MFVVPGRGHTADGAASHGLNGTVNSTARKLREALRKLSQIWKPNFVNPNRRDTTPPLCVLYLAVLSLV